MSGYRGVRLVRKTGRWQAVIMVDQHNKSLGCYATKEEAACVYNEAAQRYFGEYAMLNSVPLA